MATLKECLEQAIDVSKTAAAGLWEAAENNLVRKLCLDLVDALMKASLWQEAEKEPLVEVLAMHEDHPLIVHDAIANACDRLSEKGLLTDDLKDARDHVFDFATNKQAKLAARRTQHTARDNEIDDLMRRLRECGFC